eukprot:6373123-Amphidinium_carterae.1
MPSGFTQGMGNRIVQLMKPAAVTSRMREPHHMEQVSVIKQNGAKCAKDKACYQYMSTETQFPIR